MVALQFVTDSKDKKIPPVSYKDVLVGRDEKKVSDKKETVNEASFDGLKDVDSFASSEATLTEEYFDMYAQNGMYARAGKSPPSSLRTGSEGDDEPSHPSSPPENLIIVNTSTGAAGKLIARKKKKERRAKNKKEKSAKKKADDANFNKLIEEHKELLYSQGKKSEPTISKMKHHNNMHIRVYSITDQASSNDTKSHHVVPTIIASSSVAGDNNDHRRLSTRGGLTRLFGHRHKKKKRSSKKPKKHSVVPAIETGNRPKHKMKKEEDPRNYAHNKPNAEHLLHQFTSIVSQKISSLRNTFNYKQQVMSTNQEVLQVDNTSSPTTEEYQVDTTSRPTTGILIQEDQLKPTVTSPKPLSDQDDQITVKAPNSKSPYTHTINIMDAYTHEPMTTVCKPNVNPTGTYSSSPAYLPAGRLPEHEVKSPFSGKPSKYSSHRAATANPTSTLYNASNSSNHDHTSSISYVELVEDSSSSTGSQDNSSSSTEGPSIDPLIVDPLPAPTPVDPNLERPVLRRSTHTTQGRLKLRSGAQWREGADDQQRPPRIFARVIYDPSHQSRSPYEGQTIEIAANLPGKVAANFARRQDLHQHGMIHQLYYNELTRDEKGRLSLNDSEEYKAMRDATYLEAERLARLGSHRVENGPRLQAPYPAWTPSPSTCLTSMATPLPLSLMPILLNRRASEPAPNYVSSAASSSSDHEDGTSEASSEPPPLLHRGIDVLGTNPAHLQPLTAQQIADRFRRLIGKRTIEVPSDDDDSMSALSDES